MKFTKKVTLAVVSLLVLMVSIGIFTISIQAKASEEECAGYCIKYYNPGAILPWIEFDACMFGCLNAPQL